MRHPLRRDERGASAVEYSLLVAAIAGVLVVILVALGRHVAELYGPTCDAIGTRAAATTCE